MSDRSTDPATDHKTMAQLLQQGLFHHRQGQIQQAMERYGEVLQKDPKNADALYYVAVVACQEGQFKQGVDLVRKALSLVPPEARMLNLLGQALDRLGQPLEAVKALDQAIALDPKLAAAHANRANIMIDAGLPAEALGGSDLAGLDEAVASYTRAIKLKRGLHEAYVARGRIKLMRGDWPPGFADLEHRFELTGPDYKPPLSDPRWDGTAPRAGERLVLVADQDFGDIIQFARFAPMLAAQGHEVVVLASKGMAPLLSTLKGVTVVSTVAELDSKRPLRWLPLASVPAVLMTTPETLPREHYLSADPARVTAFADRLGTAPFKIGIIWAGTDSPHSNIPLTAFKDIAALPGVELIALQKGQPVQDIRGVAFRDKIRTIDADTNADSDFFLDTAAVISQLDLVIGPDTPAVHLAAALGRPVFTAVPAIADWRWMLQRDDSPWYPSLRVFRQDATQAWGPVFARIAAAVSEKLK